MATMRESYSSSLSSGHLRHAHRGSALELARTFSRYMLGDVLDRDANRQVVVLRQVAEQFQRIGRRVGQVLALSAATTAQLPFCWT